jgi:hypothetical protein
MENYSKSFSRLGSVSALDSDNGYNLQLRNIQVQTSCPVAVFQGPICRVQDVGGRAQLEAVEHIQLHHSTFVHGRAIPVLIDVVTETAFPKLIESILAELKTFRDRVNPMYAQLLNSALDQKRVALERAMHANLEDYLEPHMPSLY